MLLNSSVYSVAKKHFLGHFEYLCALRSVNGHASAEMEQRDEGLLNLFFREVMRERMLEFSRRRTDFVETVTAGGTFELMDQIFQIVPVFFVVFFDEPLNSGRHFLDEHLHDLVQIRIIGQLGINRCDALRMIRHKKYGSIFGHEDSIFQLVQL